MLQKIAKNALVIISLCAVFAYSITITSLRYGADNSNNDVVVEYRAVPAKFYLTFSTSFEYFNSGFVMCFRDRPIALSSTDTTSCYLQNS